MGKQPKIYYRLKEDVGLNEERVATFETLADEAGLTREQRDCIVKHGFLVAPSSFRHHSNYAGGLVDHSANVVRRLKELLELYFKGEEDKKWLSEHFNPAKVGLLHDYCKALYSEKILGNGEWTYKQLPLQGHAEVSLMALQSIGITFTPYELLAVRWHMGAYGLDADALNAYDVAIENSKNLVIFTHHADMVASRIDEREHAYTTRKEWVD